MLTRIRAGLPAPVLVAMCVLAFATSCAAGTSARGGGAHPRQSSRSMRSREAPRPHGGSVSSPGRGSQGSHNVPHHPGVPAVDAPDPRLTPGVALPVTASQVCVPGYATSVRDVSDSLKASVYARYDVRWVPYQHEIDHLISLELGGSNDIRNLWPEPYAGRWGARTKDVLENRLHELVCDGRLSLRSAQHQEATDWVGAYLRYVGTPS